MAEKKKKEAEAKPRQLTLGERASDAVEYFTGPRERGNSLASRTQEAVDAAGAAGASFIDPFGATSALLGVVSPEGKEAMRQQQSANEGASLLGGLLPLILSGVGGFGIGAARGYGRADKAYQSMEMAGKNYGNALSRIDKVNGANDLNALSKEVADYAAVPHLLRSGDEAMQYVNALGKAPPAGMATLAAMGIGGSIPAGVSFMDGERDPWAIAEQAAIGATLGGVGERFGANLVKSRGYGEPGMLRRPEYVSQSPALESQRLSEIQGQRETAARLQQMADERLASMPPLVRPDRPQPGQGMPPSQPQAAQQPVATSAPSPEPGSTRVPSQRIGTAQPRQPSEFSPYNKSNRSVAQDTWNETLDNVPVAYWPTYRPNVDDLFTDIQGRMQRPVDPDKLRARIGNSVEQFDTLREASKAAGGSGDAPFTPAGRRSMIGGADKLAVPAAFAAGLQSLRQIFVDMDGDGQPDVAINVPN